MIDHLKELAAAEPFKPFSIRMGDGTKFYITRKEDIEFTYYGSPKIYSLGKHSPDRRWHILNVDAIASISL